MTQIWKEMMKGVPIYPRGITLPVYYIMRHISRVHMILSPMAEHTIIYSVTTWFLEEQAMQVCVDNADFEVLFPY